MAEDALTVDDFTVTCFETGNTTARNSAIYTINPDQIFLRTVSADGLSPNQPTTASVPRYLPALPSGSSVVPMISGGGFEHGRSLLAQFWSFTGAPEMTALQEDTTDRQGRCSDRRT